MVREDQDAPDASMGTSTPVAWKTMGGLAHDVPQSTARTSRRGTPARPGAGDAMAAIKGRATKSSARAGVAHPTFHPEVVILTDRLSRPAAPGGLAYYPIL